MSMWISTINHEVRTLLGLSETEYCVYDMIYHMSNNPKSPVKGWCSASKEYLANSLGHSLRTSKRAIDKGIRLGLIVRQEKGKPNLKTSLKWYEAVIQQSKTSDLKDAEIKRLKAHIAKMEQKEEPVAAKEEITHLINFLNSQTGRGYKASSSENIKLLSARLKNYSVEQIEKVIEYKVNEWLNDKKMNKYLQPSTLFRKSKFENYINQMKSQPAAAKGNSKIVKMTKETVFNWADEAVKNIG